MALVYLNGELMDEAQAKISVFDRGFLFADSIYEVTAIINGRPVYLDDHFKRLTRSCQELGFEAPMTQSEFSGIHQGLIMGNDLHEGVVYLQMTRGVAERNFTYFEGLAPTVFAFSKAMDILDHPKARSGIKIKTAPDLRWARCDIKTTQLTAQSMTKTTVNRNGFDDAWMTKDGWVMEGTSNNAFIVDDRGVIITRDLSSVILAGVTRMAVIDIAKTLGFTVEERAFTVTEAQNAREAFCTSTSTIALPVIEIDGEPVGRGNPGDVYKSIRQGFIDALLRPKVVPNQMPLSLKQMRE